VTPAELVAVAEDTGEITEMGHWVLTEATHQAAGWRALGHDIAITVNVSVKQMAADGFAESVHRALHAAKLPAGSLVVEITEGQLLSEQDPAWHAVEQLRAMGVVLVIDDFGSGYSSLAYLRRMPVRGVKLDRALLEDLTTDPRARTLARAVIAAARALGLLVVAEGLETLEAARIVRDLGAFAGQGFALYEAMPGSAVAGVLAGPPVSLGADLPDPQPPAWRPEAPSGSGGLVDSAGLTGSGGLVGLVDLTSLPGPMLAPESAPASTPETASADLT
jgi:EAL domain-containing protein (putative c-di-GMP-specific phosphodiesterase class I)